MDIMELYMQITHNEEEMADLKAIAWQKRERGHKLSFLEKIALDKL